MTTGRTLAAELDAFARLVGDLADIAKRGDTHRRRELVALRRQLSDHLATLRRVGLETFAHDIRLSGEFRRRLSTALSAVAVHQADWPAVTIDQDSASYRQSAGNVASANEAFIAWTRQALQAQA